jgi:hypothetical protein
VGSKTQFGIPTEPLRIRSGRARTRPRR